MDGGDATWPLGGALKGQGINKVLRRKKQNKNNNLNV